MLVDFQNPNGVLLLQKAQSVDYQKETTEGQGYNTCDTYAVAAAINDSLRVNR